VSVFGNKAADWFYVINIIWKHNFHLSVSTFADIRFYEDNSLKLYTAGEVYVSEFRRLTGLVAAGCSVYVKKSQDQFVLTLTIKKL